MEEHLLDHENGTLFYRTIGDGEPVMLVHGFAEDSEIWNKLTDDLRDEYRLIIPDLPGSGRSTGEVRGVTIDLVARQLAAIADHQQLGEFTMIGHSMGGYIALAFAEKYGPRLAKLGLFHSSAFADNEEKVASRKKNIEFINNHGAAKFLEQTVPKLFSPDFSRDNPEVIAGMISKYSNFPPETLVYYTDAMIDRPDRTHVLKEFKKPVLFILGEFDTAVPLEQGLKQCSIPEFSYIYIAAHSGHMGMLEEPGFCLKGIKDFLTGI